jgi:hypothetical protein
MNMDIENTINSDQKRMINKVTKAQIAIIEREVCKLTDVFAARLVTDLLGRPIELHIVAAPNKTPKQVAKDVHSILLATFALSIDHRIISVVQIISDNSDPKSSVNKTSNNKVRPKIDKVIVEKNDNYAVARVTLKQESNFYEGFAQGSVASVSRNRLVAQATIDSLTQINTINGSLDIISADCISNSEYTIAVVALVFVEGSVEESLAGSAIIKDGDVSLAIAKAVLSATNRRLTLVNNL